MVANLSLLWYSFPMVSGAARVHANAGRISCEWRPHVVRTMSRFHAIRQKCVLMLVFDSIHVCIAILVCY